MGKVMTFQERILEARVALDLSQEDLAEILQVGKKTIYNWETKAPGRKKRRGLITPHILTQEGALNRLKPLNANNAKRVAAAMREFRLAQQQTPHENRKS